MGWKLNGARPIMNPGVARGVYNLGIKSVNEREIKTVPDRPEIANSSLQYMTRA